MIDMEKSLTLEENEKRPLRSGDGRSLVTPVND
jgi:hypothetical protein